MLILGLSVKINAQPKVKNHIVAPTKVSVIQKPIETDTTDQLQGSGLMGYIPTKGPQSTSGYGAGIEFYVAVYPTLPQPIADFQIGLPPLVLFQKTLIIPPRLFALRVLMQEIIGRMGVDYLP